MYSLACVLYEMLAGEPPFTGPTAQVILARHSLDPVPSLRTARRTVPLGMEQAIVRALAKMPADRYSTAAEFAEALTSPAITPRPARPRARVIVGELTAGAAAVAAILALNVGGLRDRLWGEDPAIRIRALAVLPLESLSADRRKGTSRMA